MTLGIVGESDLTGTMKSEYIFFGGERVARRDLVAPTGVFYYFSDHLKTTDLVTDAQGTIRNESDFYPWGGELQFLANDSNHYKFTGKERDDETQLDYFGARYYSNGMGRFITPDWAAKAAAVPYAEFADPQSLNLYSYVRNVPTTRFDVDGHFQQGQDKTCLAQNTVNNFKLMPDDLGEALKGLGRQLVNKAIATANLLSGGQVSGGFPLTNEDQHVGANAADQLMAASPLLGEMGASTS